MNDISTAEADSATCWLSKDQNCSNENEVDTFDVLILTLNQMNYKKNLL